MNAERLLQHYEQIADAPDAIARLRRFILDLAVRGKLVPQDPADEPASELLKRIAAEKSRLVETGEIRDRTNSSQNRGEPIRFACPPGWSMTTLGEVALKITDGAHKTPTYVERGIPFVSVKDFSGGALDLSKTRFIPENEHRLLYQRCDPRRGDILLGRIGTLGKAVLVETDIEFSLFVSVGLIRFHHHNINQSFFRLLLNSPFVEAEFDRIKIGGGTHTNKLNLGDLHTVALPLSPLAEQHRIVAKVDELMALCDELETARTERETKRDRLAAASLARLNSPDPETFRDNARFGLDALPALTARPDQIKQLRQAILNLAVRGKLVPQDPADEPAEELDKNLASELPQPFEIPQSWTWSRLSAVGKLKGGGTPSKSNGEFWNGDIPWVSPKDMKIDYISEAQMAITEKAVKESSVNLIDRGSLLFVVRGMILAHSFPVAITRDVVTVNQDMKALIPKTKEMAEYLLRALKGLKPQMLARVQRSSHGTCRLEGADYADFLIPIPPLAEQHRIVAKVDELMALCDQLETSLTSADETRKKLLDALLAEALAPVNAEALHEAAE
ncbi:restriction endonuclease subunit S [Agrobacterium sp. S2]|nr:restriction endonuclease subunit S [Agrobacterium sp. S2]